MEDRQRKIWFLSYSAAFSFYDMSDRKVHTVGNPLNKYNQELTWGIISHGSKGTIAFTSGKGNLFLRPDGQLFSITKTTHPNYNDLLKQVPIWCQNHDDFIIPSLYENETFLADTIPPLLPDRWQSFSSQIYTFIFYRNHTIIAKAREISRYNGHRFHSKSIHQLSKHTNDRLVRISRIGKTELLLVITQKGQFVIDKNLNRLHQYDFIEQLKVNSLLIDRENNLWIATKDEGILLITWSNLNMSY